MQSLTDIASRSVDQELKVPLTKDRRPEELAQPLRVPRIMPTWQTPHNHIATLLHIRRRPAASLLHGSGYPPGAAHLLGAIPTMWGELVAYVQHGLAAVADGPGPY
jgi:hypothetical protein